MRGLGSGLSVLLSAHGNIDYGQDPEAEVAPTILAEVIDYKDASELCQRYIAEHMLGAGQWTGGAIFDESGHQVAHVSYNGRVWSADQKNLISERSKL